MSPVSRPANSPHIECLLDAERVLVPEPEAARRRVVGRARAAVFGGGLRGPAVDAEPLRGFPLSKAVAAMVLLAGLTAGAYELGYRRSRTTTEVIAPSVAPVPSASPAAVEATPPSESLTEPLSPPPQRRARSRPLPSRGVDTYASELRLLRPAQAALGRLAFADALALVDEHQRRFASGHLAEEREALRVKALLGLDRRDDARRAVAAFRVRFPNSALLARIQAMLETAP